MDSPREQLMDILEEKDIVDQDIRWPLVKTPSGPGVPISPVRDVPIKPRSSADFQRYLWSRKRESMGKKEEKKDPIVIPTPYKDTEESSDKDKDVYAANLKSTEPKYSDHSFWRSSFTGGLGALDDFENTKSDKTSKNQHRNEKCKDENKLGKADKSNKKK